MMGLFKRDAQHIEVAAEKPSLAEAVQSARDALQQAETALASHDTEAARLLRELEISTSALDAATLAGDERQIEALIRQRFDIQQRLESLGRVRPHRASQVEEATAALYQAERATAAEQQRHLIGGKGEMNRRIVQSVETLAGLIAEAEGMQTEIYQLADTWQLPRPAVRWSLPPGFTRSKAAERLRSALDLHHVFGLDLNAGQIISDDIPATEEELLPAERAALADEVAHV